MADEEELIKDMITQVTTHLDKLDMLLMKARNQPNTPRAMDDIHGEFHAIKSMVSFFEFKSLENLAENAQLLLETLRHKGATLSIPMITSLLSCIDAIRDILNDISENGKESAFIYGDILDNLMAFLDSSDIVESKLSDDHVDNQQEIEDAIENQAINEEQTDGDDLSEAIEKQETRDTEEELEEAITEAGKNEADEQETEQETELTDAIDQQLAEDATDIEEAPVKKSEPLHEKIDESLDTHAVETDEAVEEPAVDEASEVAPPPAESTNDSPLVNALAGESPTIEDGVSSFILQASRSMVKLKEHFSNDNEPPISEEDLNALGTVCRTIADFIEHQLDDKNETSTTDTTSSVETQNINQPISLLIAEGSRMMRKIMEKYFGEETLFEVSSCDSEPDAVQSEIDSRKVQTLIIDPSGFKGELEKTLKSLQHNDIKVIFYTDASNQQRPDSDGFNEIPTIFKAGLEGDKKISLDESLHKLKEALLILSQ